MQASSRHQACHPCLCFFLCLCLGWLFRQHLAKDPGHVQAAFWLAAVTPGPQVAACPPEIVSKLFDAYADKFDDHLTGSLGYKTPGMLM